VLAVFLREAFQVSDRRCCKVLELTRATFGYQSRAKDRTLLKMRLKDLALGRPRYGYRRLHVLLRREGILVNHKLVQRL